MMPTCRMAPPKKPSFASRAASMNWCPPGKKPPPAGHPKPLCQIDPNGNQTVSSSPAGWGSLKATTAIKESRSVKVRRGSMTPAQAAQDLLLELSMAHNLPRHRNCAYSPGLYEADSRPATRMVVTSVSFLFDFPARRKMPRSPSELAAAIWPAWTAGTAEFGRTQHATAAA